MKKALVLSSCFLLSLTMSMIAQAQTSDTSTSVSTNTTQTDNPKSRGHRSCMAIASACEVAGYRLSKTIPGKNIWKDCVKPILAGQAISGVTADPADIQACKARKSTWKNKHDMQKTGETTTPQANTPSTSQ